MRLLLIVAGAVALHFLLNRLFGGVARYTRRRLRERGRTAEELEKQAATIAGIMGKVTAILVYTFALVLALRELGFDLGPLIAGAGFVGVALGLGAQNVVRDVFAGFFILIENQIRVNDVAVINDVGGVVEEINLRTTVLRDIEGTVHVFQNGNIAKLANRTQDFSYYLFTLSLPYGGDVDEAIGIVRRIGAEVQVAAPYRADILESLEVLGVDQLTDSHVILKARIKTHPGKQWEVGRDMNRRIKAALEAAGIELPARGPRKVELQGVMDRDLLKSIVREVLQETGAPASAKKRPPAAQLIVPEDDEPSGASG